MSSGVHPYATLAEDPTSEASIHWLDDSGEGGDEQTLAYGTDSDNLDSSAVDAGEEMPERTGTFRYSVSLTDLEPATTYHAEIQRVDGDVTDLEFRTLPSEIDDATDNEVRILEVSDSHCGYTGTSEEDNDLGTDPATMDVLAAKDPHLVLWGGDLNHNADTKDSDAAQLWVEFVSDWLSRLNEDRLVPIFAVPGNHDVGGSSFDGETDVPDRNAGYFNYMMRTQTIDVADRNYGGVTIGNYVQVLGIDTHSEAAEDMGDALPDLIDETVPLCMPFHHSPLFAGQERLDSDPDLQANLQEAWFKHLAEADNIHFSFAGHIHNKTDSKPVTLADDPPDTGDYTAISDGYIVEDDDGFIEIGDGFPKRPDREFIDNWYVDEIDRETQDFKTITLTENSPVEAEVVRYDENGNVVNSHSFTADGPGLQTEYDVYGKIETDRISLS